MSPGSSCLTLTVLKELEKLKNVTFTRILGFSGWIRAHWRGEDDGIIWLYGNTYAHQELERR